MFVRSWAHLRHGSSLGLEPFPLVLIIYFIESLSRFVSNYYFVLFFVSYSFLFRVNFHFVLVIVFCLNIVLSRLVFNVVLCHFIINRCY